MLINLDYKLKMGRLTSTINFAKIFLGIVLTFALIYFFRWLGLKGLIGILFGIIITAIAYEKKVVDAVQMMYNHYAGKGGRY